MTPPPLSRRLVLLLAFACGATVANLYYAQPLLDVIASDLGVAPSTAALLVTASQIGYAAGLMLLVPLGDLLDRRRMLTRLLALTAVGMAVAAAAPGFAVLAIAIAVVGFTSVVAQVLVPFASVLAREDERGRVVGTVMSGLLIGILAARTISGFVAALGGWRLVFALGAGLMLVLAAALGRALPAGPPADEPPPSYGALLRSVGTLVLTEPLLRRRMAFGACGMAAFTVLWTSLALYLAGPPFRYGEATIGLFGLAGLVGAGSAQLAGRLADRGLAHVATAAFWVAVALGWVLLLAGRTSVAAIIAGIVILDFGVQGQHIVNQSTIYTLRPELRSRLTTAYMTGNFLTGAVASAAAAAAWSMSGWDGVCWLGLAFAVIAGLVWLTDDRTETARAGRAAAAETAR